MNTADDPALPSQAVTICAWSSEKHGLALSWWRIMHFPCLILDTFCQVPLSVSLTGSSSTCWNCLVFQKESITEDSLPIPPYTQHHLLWMKTGLWYRVGDGSFHLPHSLFRSTLLYSIYFLSPITVVFKTKDRMFSLCVSRESHVEIQSRGFLS